MTEQRTTSQLTTNNYRRAATANYHLAMAVSESYLALVLEQMAGVRAVVTKRMQVPLTVLEDADQLAKWAKQSLVLPAKKTARRR